MHSSVSSSHLEQIQWVGDAGLKCFLLSPWADPEGWWCRIKVFPPLTFSRSSGWGWCRIYVFPPLTLSRSSGWVMQDSSVSSSHLEPIQWVGDLGFKCFLLSPWADPVDGWCRIQVFPPLTLSRSSGFVMQDSSVSSSHIQQIQWMGVMQDASASSFHLEQI
jgi:hypothetical protein